MAMQVVHLLGILFRNDENDSEMPDYFLMEAGRCDNGCIWNSDAHSVKDEWEVELEKVLDFKTCWKCYGSRPESLYALCQSKIVTSEKLVKMACLVLPSLLIPSLMQQAVRRFDAVQDLRMKSTIRILMEYWPYRVLDISTLTRRLRSVLLVRELAVDRFIETISSSNLMNELVVSDSDGVPESPSEPDIWGHTSFLEYIRKRTEEYAINKENLERKYILRTNVAVSFHSGAKECVQHLRFLQRSRNSPFDIRIVKITCIEIKMAELFELFSVIDPKYVESVCVMLARPTARDIRRLKAILREFRNLTNLYLNVEYANRSNRDDEHDVSNAVSTLIDRLPQGITTLDLQSCPMSGHLERYKLPMFLKELRLCWIHMTSNEYEQFADLNHFPVLTCFSLDGFLFCEGLIKFISNHASTLTKLEMTYSLNHDSSYIKALADHFRKFGILEDFTYSFRYNDESVYETLRELIENFLVIESLTHLHLIKTGEFLQNSENLETLKGIVDRISMERRNPFDFCCIEHI